MGHQTRSPWYSQVISTDDQRVEWYIWILFMIKNNLKKLLIVCAKVCKELKLLCHWHEKVRKYKKHPDPKQFRKLCFSTYLPRKLVCKTLDHPSDEYLLPFLFNDLKSCTNNVLSKGVIGNKQNQSGPQQLEVSNPQTLNLFFHCVLLFANGLFVAT